jgi:YbbR domain-containing protein
MIRLIRNFFINNWALKLTAIVLAFILWLALMPEEKILSERTITVPLETRNLSRDFELVEKPQSTVDVTFRAPNRLLNRISASDMSAVLSLEKATLSQEDYPLNPDIIVAPPDAKIVRVFPNKVHLKLERSKEDMMEVQPILIGKVKAGSKIDGVELVPSKVFVRGPESKFKTKEKIRTSPVDVTDLDKTTEFDVDLILPKPELRFTTAMTRAKVKVVISSK